MSKAIVLVAFGSSNIEGINKSIGLLERDLVSEFSEEYTILKAFTSKSIINILKEKHDITVPHITKALFNLGNDGYSEVIIQPLHIMKGKDNRDIEEIVNEYKYSFKKIVLSKSLLGFEDDELIKESNRLAKAISKEVETGTILLAGHGSKESSNKPYYILECSLTKELGKKFYMATLEGDRTIEHVVADLKYDKIKDIIIKPLFIIPGKHVLDDIQNSENSWTDKLSKVGINAKVDSKSLLESEKVRKIFIEKIRMVVENNKK